MGLFDKFKKNKQNDNHYQYYEWDEDTFILPDEYVLTSQSDLADALNVFFINGGYDFFEVIDTRYYSPKWLEFMGDLYVSITEDKYYHNKEFKNPLTENQKKILMEQGVPDVFISDIKIY